MSFFVDLEMPGLTRETAIAIGRRADLAGMPLALNPPRSSGVWRRERSAHVWMDDLENEPSLSSETLDHPEGWPQDAEVRDWLTRTVRFLGENAPEGVFSFHAGWPEHTAREEIDVGLDEFLGLIERGRLRSRSRYAIRCGE